MASRALEVQERSMRQKVICSPISCYAVVDFIFLNRICDASKKRKLFIFVGFEGLNWFKFVRKQGMCSNEICNFARLPKDIKSMIFL
jgi:hypothetical protein